MTFDLMHGQDAVKDDHLRELMERAWEGIGECAFAPNCNRRFSAALTFALLGILGVLRKPKGGESPNEYADAVKSTPALIARMKSARAISAPLWFVNEVAQVTGPMFGVHADDEPAANKFVNAEYMVTTQVASCALWSLGFGELDTHGVSEFAKHVHGGCRLGPDKLN
jgi:hypothetical protein